MSKPSQFDLSRLYWACRRGMLELDIILMQFLKDTYQTLSTVEQQLFVDLLDSTDADLYRWLVLGESSANQFNVIIDKIRTPITPY